MNNKHTFLFLFLFFLFINFQKSNAQPYVFLGPDRSVSLAAPTTIEPQFISDEIYQVSWSSIPEMNLPCSQCLSFEITVLVPTLFAIQITDDEGRTATDTIAISIDYSDDIYIPNVFSPNGDGYNDFFYVFGGPSVKSIKQMAIKDRNMITVFYKKDISPNFQEEGWDGKLRGKRLDMGVFIYSIEIEYIDGRTKIFHGHVMIFF